MPLYELVLITRAGPAMHTSTTLSSICNNILQSPSTVIRDVQSLGDRIMAKNLNYQGESNLVGRYIQIIYDGPPSIYQKTLSFVNSNNLPVFRMHVSRMKEEDYLQNIQERVFRLKSKYYADLKPSEVEFLKQAYDFKLKNQKNEEDLETPTTESGEESLKKAQKL